MTETDNLGLADSLLLIFFQFNDNDIECIMICMLWSNLANINFSKQRICITLAAGVILMTLVSTGPRVWDRQQMISANLKQVDQVARGLPVDFFQAP